MLEFIRTFLKVCFLGYIRESALQLLFSRFDSLTVGADTVGGRQVNLYLHLYIKLRKIL